jgi:ABC-type transport system involved in multi-copper enzyme maturation permease subunit
MIFWKEWRALRGRFLALGAFYAITALLLPVDVLIDVDWIEVVPVTLLGWGALLILIPAILGMDAYVGERDQETEDFLLSKPMSKGRLIAAKYGSRALLTLLLTAGLLALLMVRIGGAVDTLYLSTRPYVVWYVILSVLAGQQVVLMLTMAVSVRAPFQSTALILGGSLGAAVAAAPVLTSSWQLTRLQAPWSSFRLLVVLLLLSGALACSVLLRREVGRSSA